MFHSKLNQSLLVRIILALVLLVGVGFTTWLLSTPSLNAASRLAPLTFSSPIGDPQFSLSKTVNNNAPTAGDQVSYTLSYANTRLGSQAFNVRLYDFLPAGVQFISSNPPATPDSNGVLLFTAPAVGPDTNSTNVTIRVRVPQGHAQMINHALVVADGVTPTVASLLTNITQTSSNWLRLVKLGYTAVLSNSELVYRLQATNVGAVALNDVTVVDVLPGGVAFVGSAPAPNLITPPMLRWSLGTLAPLESRTIFITTTAPGVAGVITNSAVANAYGNIMTQTLFSTQVVNADPILRVTKTGSAAAVDLGKTLVYTLRYSNAGNQPATTLRLTDTLPANVTVIGASPAPTSQTAQQLVWNLSPLAVGAQGQVVITTTVGGAAGRILHNVVDITGQAGSYPGHDELDTQVRLVILYLPLIMKN